MKTIKILAICLSTFLVGDLLSQDTRVEKTDVIIYVNPDDVLEYAPSEKVSNPPIGDRIVFWVHGLGGNEYSWDGAAAPTGDNYKITSLLNGIDYSSYSLSNAGQVLQNTIDGQSAIYSELLEVDDPANSSFIIAHSQGGLVSRAAYKRYVDLNAVSERSFGGIVTFGTPHQGAVLLDNVPAILDFISSSCNDLTAGPALEFWNGNWFLSLLPSTGFQNAVEGVCNFIGSDVAPLVMQDYLQPITEDYHSESEVLSELNTFDEELENDPETDIARVAFYGVEDDPVVWRTLYSRLNDVNAVGPFEADYDEGLLAKVNENTAMYYNKYMAYSNLWDLINTPCVEIIGAEALIPFWGFFACQEQNLNENYNEYGSYIQDNVSWWPFWPYDQLDARDAYYAGWRWWVDIEENYLSFIGAIDYQIDHCHCDCLEKYGSDPAPVDVTQIVPCTTENCDFYTENPPPNTNVIHCDYAIVYERYIKDNDGIVLAESAKDYPGADNDDGNRMDGSNHIQMRNDTNTGNAIEELTVGDHGTFFITSER